MKHISPTFVYHRPYQVNLRLTTFTKTLPQMSFPLKKTFPFDYASADWHCWSAHRTPSAHNSFKRVHDWCKAVWRRPGPPPQTKILATPVMTINDDDLLTRLFLKCIRCMIFIGATQNIWILHERPSLLYDHTNRQCQCDSEGGRIEGFYIVIIAY